VERSLEKKVNYEENRQGAEKRRGEGVGHLTI
jgi:hypothetical protein